MSSRHLRKLEAENTAAAEPGTEVNGDDSDISSTEEDTSAPRTNLFSLLNESESEVKEDDDHDTSAPTPSAERTHLPVNGTAAAPGAATNRRKKRKKKKSKRLPTASSEDTAVSEADDIDALVREMNFFPGSVGGADSKVVTTAERKESAIVRDVLTVERRHLNPDNEMRRVFGREVVDQRRRTGGGRRTVLHHHHHHHHHVSRQFAMVNNVQRFVHPGKLGLTMTAPERVGSELWFQYVHGKAYQDVELLFLAAVESVNPDNILALMNAHPGHVNSVLQLAEVCRLGEDLALSAELLERALYTLESAAHPLFSVTAGTARLDYRRRENRVFFLALFRHIRALSERGCHRTALEFCKLLLSVQPVDDPVGAILMMDHFALKAHEYRWLIRFQEQWEPVRNLSQLPSWSYSVPFARLMLAQTESDQPTATTLRSQADAGLQDALILFPSLLPLLLEKCEIRAPAEVTRADMFSISIEKSQPDALNVLCRLYAERSAHLWKTAGVDTWLLHNAAVVAQMSGNQQDSRIAAAQLNRKKRYVGMPLSICRHVMCSEMKEARSRLPAEYLSRAVVSHDPLPPADSTAGYQLQRPAAGGQQPSSANPLASFFYSLLPNYDPAQPPPHTDLLNDRLMAAVGGGDEVAGAGAGAAARDDVEGLGEHLRTSVTSLLDAMRDLLTNLAPQGAAAGGQDEDDGQEASDEEDAWAEP